MPRQPKAKATQNGAQTEYIVLRRVSLALEGDNAPYAWATMPETEEAPQIFPAGSKQAAIRMCTGDDASVIEGTWRAIPLSSWRGGITTKRVTAAERLPLD